MWLKYIKLFEVHNVLPLLYKTLIIQLHITELHAILYAVKSGTESVKVCPSFGRFCWLGFYGVMRYAHCSVGFIDA